MKRLLISEVFPPQTGGSGRWLWELYRRLPREQVVVAAGEYAAAQAFDHTHDLRVFRTPLTLQNYGFVRPAGAWAYWRALRVLRRIIASEGITEIHCGRTIPEGWMAWLLKLRYGLPYLCYVHGEEMKFARASRELTWMMRRVLGSARFVIANSRNTRRLLLEQWGLPAANVRLLHPGVDAARFVPERRDEATRRSLGWADRTVVLTVGRLQKRKGHDMLIRALPRIRQSVSDVLYAIVGAGDEQDYLGQLAREQGVADCVQFLGEPDDGELVRCYQQCDLFVLPNREFEGDIEGFGMVLVEAQACGKAVIAGDSGGTAETMRVGETGLIVDCTQPEPLAAAVIGLLLDASRRERMGRAAREWAVEQFDWEGLTRQAREIFAETALTGDDRRRAVKVQSAIQPWVRNGYPDEPGATLHPVRK